MPVISLTGVGRRYGRYQALADVTADIGTPTITGEAAELLNRVLVIDHGRVVLDAPADDLRAPARSSPGRPTAWNGSSPTARR